MQTVETHGTFDDVIRGSSGEVKELAQLTHDLIADIYPDVFVVPWPRQKIVGYGVGPKKMSEHFAYIGLFAKHINLGFNYGADLPDPEKLLEGSGKKFRKVSIRAKEELGQAGVRKLIEAAIRERQIALGM